MEETLSRHYDLIIVGAGLVGTSLAVALQNQGFSIALLETHLPDFTATHNHDGRPLSLSYGSQRILQTMGLWEKLATKAVPILAVHVSEQKRFGSVCFRAAEEQVPALGFVAPMEQLQQILYQQASHQPEVHFLAIEKVINIQSLIEKDGKQITVETFEGEKTLSTDLLIGADGANSTTRQLLNIDVKIEDIQEMAITVTLHFSLPHQNRAFERFTTQGILAVLPLINPHQGQLVWTLDTDTANQVTLWSDTQLTAFLQASFGERLGNIQILTRGKSYPLQLIIAQEQIRPGVVLLGNAAHTLYPLAAQGFNLALRDVAMLSEILVEARKNKNWLGSPRILESYYQKRQKDQNWMYCFNKGMSQLFDLQIPGLGNLRSLGLLSTDLFPPLKRRLAKRLMGLTGYLPRLARGVTL